MDFKFSEEQQAIIEAVREFVACEIAPHVEEIQTNDQPPKELFKKAGEAGILGIAFPEAYGGLGQSYETLTAAYKEIAKVAPGSVISFSTTAAVSNILRHYGTEEQKEKYIRPAINGEIVTSMAFTESETGSDPKQLRTIAQEDGTDIILNGSKRFITNASYPGPMVIYAKEADTGVCSAFLIDKFCEGYSISTPWDKIGTKGSPVYDVFLDNVRIPASNRIGAKGEGFTILLSESAVGKLAHCAVSLGIMEACRDIAIRYAAEKMHRDKPITKFQAIQLKISKICEMTESIRWMTYYCSQLADKNPEDPEFQAYASLTKAYAADTVMKGAFYAMNIMGAYGPMKEYNLERFLRDASMEAHVEVVSDVQRVIAAQYFIKEVLKSK